MPGHFPLRSPSVPAPRGWPRAGSPARPGAGVGQADHGAQAGVLVAALVVEPDGRSSEFSGLPPWAEGAADGHRRCQQSVVAHVATSRQTWASRRATCADNALKKRAVSSISQVARRFIADAIPTRALWKLPFSSSTISTFGFTRGRNLTRKAITSDRVVSFTYSGTICDRICRDRSCRSSRGVTIDSA